MSYVFFLGELPQNKRFYNWVSFQLDHSMAPALLFPHALLSKPESYLHFHMLKSSLVLKATQSGNSSMILFPVNLSHILHPCVFSCVILDEIPGCGRQRRSRTTSQKYHVFYTSESACRTLINVSWRSHYSELTPFQPLHVINPYQQKYCYLGALWF